MVELELLPREMCFSPFLVYKTGIIDTLKRLLILGNYFSVMLVIGISTRIKKKYKIDASCLTIMKGCSMGCSRIHVSVKRSATSTQKQALAESLKCDAVFFRCMEHWEEC